MFGKRKPAQPKGQGAAAAKQVSSKDRQIPVPLSTDLCLTCWWISRFTSWFQMGLFLELDPEQVMMEANLDDPDLEAELAAITGNKAGAGGKAKPKRKSKHLAFLLLMDDLGNCETMGFSG